MLIALAVFAGFASCLLLAIGLGLINARAVRIVDEMEAALQRARIAARVAR